MDSRSSMPSDLIRGSWNDIVDSPIESGNDIIKYGGLGHEIME